MEPRCSRCGEQAVEYDGQSICQGCGFVISEGNFVAETGAEGQQLGQHVNANGRVSGEQLASWFAFCGCTHAETCTTDVPLSAGGSGRNGYHLGLVNGILPQQFPVSCLTCVYSTHWEIHRHLGHCASSANERMHVCRSKPMER